MKTNNILILSEYFYPDLNATGYSMTAIAERLVKGKNNVTVITASNKSNSLSNKKIDKKIKIHRLKSLSLNKNNVFERLLKLFLMTISFTIKTVLNLKKVDKILIVTNPAFVVLIIPIIKIIKKNIKATVLVHDVFPENLHASNILKNSSIFYKFLNYIFNICYGKFDNIITLGCDMSEIFKSKINPKNHHKIKVITNWSQTNDIKPTLKKENPIIKKFKLENKIVILFAGNMGRLQGIERLIPIISTCNNEKFHFLFIGDGAILDDLKNEVIKNKISNITFIDGMPRENQNIFLNACDIGLVTLSPKMYGLGVPSKSYNILAAGKPILFIGNPKSEIALMIKSSKTGWVIGNNDIAKIPTLLNEIYDQKCIKIFSQQCRKLALSKYSKKIVLDKYYKLILK